MPSIAQWWRSVLWWTLGAVTLAVLSAFINVFFIGSVDYAYGAEGAMLMSLLMFAALLVPGVIGCLIALSLRTNRVSARVSFAAGAAFAVTLLAVLFALGRVPGIQTFATAFLLAVFLGMTSVVFWPANAV